jgi:hypothetical protein
MMSSLKPSTFSRALVSNRQWLGKAVRAISAVGAVRCLSSVSPVFRHDDDDNEQQDHHHNTLNRPIPAWQPIEIRSPPILGTAKNISRPVQESSSSMTFQVTEHQDGASTFVSPSEIKYTGDAIIPITNRLHLIKPGEDAPRGIWPVFRLMVSAC